MTLLRIYLQDHAATYTGLLELAKRALGSNEGTSFEQPLAQLRDEIADDRVLLADVMEKLGMTRDRVKDGAAWAAEKAGRLKLNGRVREYSPLSRVVELEGLAMLLLGQRRLWETLAARADDARLAGVALTSMPGRIDAQLARVEDLHGRATALAFAAGAATP